MDTPEDYELLKAVYKQFYKDGMPVDIKMVFRFLDDHPEIANINRFVDEKQVNFYVEDLRQKPVFTVHQNKSGKFLIKNRMGEIVSPVEFKNILTQAQWEEV